MFKQNLPLGYILYEGPSQIDGSPIVVIVNKIYGQSANSKTGHMVQTFIIRSDFDPVDAINNGSDISICGDCIHRPFLAKQTGEAPCYVNAGQSVKSVFKAYKRGRYIKASASEVALYLSGLIVRIGTYGDPFAAPVNIWKDLIKFAAGHAGYSHQWQNPKFDHELWAPLVMASADNIDQAALANLHGMRVFRVSIGSDKQAGEVSCPASREAGSKTTCNNCLLCGGTSKQAKDIVIQDHARGHEKRVIMLATV